MNKPEQYRTNSYVQSHNLTTVQATIICDYLTGHTEAQTAERLNVSLFQVRVNVKRIQRKLKGGAAF